MASNAEKGKKTRQHIVEIAKRLFYFNGYDSVLVKDIIEACSISAGNLTYYFPTKDTIAVEIFTQYISNIFKFIEEKIPGIDHFYYKNLYMSSIFNIVIFNNKNYARFYKEVMNKKSHHYLLRQGIDDVYIQLVKSFDISYSAEEYRYFTFSDLGARHEILIGFMNGEFPELNPISLTRILHNNTIKLLGIDQQIFDAMFTEVANNVDYLDVSEVQLL